jgi:hypothetical protein
MICSFLSLAVIENYSNNADKDESLALNLLLPYKHSTLEFANIKNITGDAKKMSQMERTCVTHN